MQRGLVALLDKRDSKQTNVALLDKRDSKHIHE
jgi:hypothetical protein